MLDKEGTRELCGEGERGEETLGWGTEDGVRELGREGDWGERGGRVEEDSCFSST